MPPAHLGSLVAGIVTINARVAPLIPVSSTTPSPWIQPERSTNDQARVTRSRSLSPGS